MNKMTADDLQPGQRVLLDIPSEEYHNLPYVSSGMIRTILTDGEYTCHARHVAKTIAKDETGEMRLGRFFHLAAESPDGWQKKIRLIPRILEEGEALKLVQNQWSEKKTKAPLHHGADLNLRYPAHRQWLQLVSDAGSATGLEAVSEEEFEIVGQQVAAVRENPATSWLLNNQAATYEQCGLYRDPETDLIMKGLADVLIEPLSLVVDYKTNRYHTAEQYIRHACSGDAGVYIQLAHYCIVFGTVSAAVVSVRNHLPTEALYLKASEARLESAKRMVRAGLEQIRDCYALESWHSRGWGQTLLLDY